MAPFHIFYGHRLEYTRASQGMHMDKYYQLSKRGCCEQRM